MNDGVEESVISEIQYYILTASSIRTPDSTISAPDVILGRSKKGYWPLGERTNFRDDLKAGDKVLLYAASRFSIFLASATVDSPCLAPRYVRRLEIEYEYDYLHGFPYGIKLREVRYFTKPVRAKDLIEDLKFIKNTNRWGIHLQGGAVRIDRDDFDLIVSHAD